MRCIIIKKDKEVYIFDQEGTNLNMVRNNLTKDKIEESIEQRNEICAQVDLGIENTMANIGGVYITSKANATDYTEMYGWSFYKVIIQEM